MSTKLEMSKFIAANNDLISKSGVGIAPMLDEVVITDGETEDERPLNIVSGNSNAREAPHNVTSYITEAIISGKETNSFMVTNLATVEAQYKLWMSHLPFVEPFYAVKCNPNPDIIQLLADLGCGFDCATLGEIRDISKTLRSTPGRRQRIVYAQPAKMEAHLRYALKQGVTLMVFDSEDELYKIATLLREINEEYERGQNQQAMLSYSSQVNTSRRQFLSRHWNFKPEARLLLRITTTDADSICAFSNKFGCDAGTEGRRLLEIAHCLGLTVAGVSFHVGSGCGDPHAYTEAISDAASLFLHGRSLGIGEAMTVLDIGGGFPGDPASYYNDGNMPTFEQLAATIREAVTTFESTLGESWANRMRYIAEPGRFFASASTTLATRIYSRKSVVSPATGVTQQALYVDDGVYGTFNNVVYDHYHPPVPLPLRLVKQIPYKWARERAAIAASETSADTCGPSVATEFPTAIFGPTCDGLDQLCDAERCHLQRLDVGDWLLWECMGAYTHTASFTFNGYEHVPRTHSLRLDLEK